MDMDHSPRVLDKLLEQCVEVSVERKSEILCEWAGKRMCHGLPLASCDCFFDFQRFGSIRLS